MNSNADANAMTGDVDNNDDAAVAAQTPADADLLDAVLPAGRDSRLFKHENATRRTEISNEAG